MSSSWFARLRAALCRSHSRYSPIRRTALWLEALEDRCVPSRSSVWGSVFDNLGDQLLSANLDGDYSQQAPLPVPPSVGAGGSGAVNATMPFTGTPVGGVGSAPLGQSAAVAGLSLQVGTSLAQAGPAPTPEGRANAITVTNTNDTGPGSLRAAVDAANMAGGTNTITFASSIAGQTITLSSNDTKNPFTFGPTALVVNPTDNLTINAACAPGLTISGGSAHRIFGVLAGGSLTLVDDTISGGKAQGGNGGSGCGAGGGGGAGMGGAIFNNGTLSILNSTLSGNTAQGGCGGLGKGTGAGSGGGAAGGGGAGSGGFAGGGGGVGGPSFSPCGGPNQTGCTTPAGQNGTLGGGGGGGGGSGRASSCAGFGGGGGGCGGPGGFGGGGGGGGGGSFGGCSSFGGGGGGGAGGCQGGCSGFGGGNGGFSTPTASGGGGGGAGLGGAIFNNQGASLSLTNSTLSGNIAQGGAGGGSSCGFVGGCGQGLGGAVLNLSGTVTIQNSALASNSAPQGGGGIASVQRGGTATLNVTGSTISGNRVVTPPFGPVSGGGILNSGGTVNISYSTLSGNTVTNPLTNGEGGGLANEYGTATLSNSTISGNTASSLGGGILNKSGSLSLTNCTVSGNTVISGSGGGINSRSGFNPATVALLNCTLANNSPSGLEIGTITGMKPSSATFLNTIFANNGPNVVISGGTATSQGHNISSDATGNLTGPGDKPNTNPMLGGLANNGGPTLTQTLLPGSPALGAGTTTGAPNVDQRGFARPDSSGPIDIGAVQVSKATSTTTLTSSVNPSGVGQAVTFTATVSIPGSTAPASAIQGTVTFLDGGTTLATVTLVNGSASFTSSSLTDGNHTLTAIYNPAANFPATSSTSAPLTQVIGSGGTFFTDGSNQLWLYQNGVFTNTGAFASHFTTAQDAQGNPEAFFTDGNNQLWRYDQGTLTPLNAFATHLAIGEGDGMFAFTDGNNQIWTYSDASGFHMQNAFATALWIGFDSNGNNQISFLDGSNQLWLLDPKTGLSTNSGAFAQGATQGRDTQGNNETWFRDGFNHVWRLDQGALTMTNTFATQLAGSQGQLFYADGVNNLLTIADGASFGTYLNASAAKLTSSVAFQGAFFLDGNNQLWLWQNGTFTNTSGFGQRLVAF